MFWCVSSSTCPPINDRKQQNPYICSAPIKVCPLWFVNCVSYGPNFPNSFCLVFQYKYANHSNSEYTKTGKNTVKFQLINQRADFSFGLFSGGLSNVSIFIMKQKIPANLCFCVPETNICICINHLNSLQPKLVAVSNSISFANPKAPLYPRLAQGKSWDEVGCVFIIC